MRSGAGAIRPSGRPTRSEQLAALGALVPELGMATRLSAEPPRPYLVVSMFAVYRERVFVGQSREGVCCYLWVGGHAAHPVRDPMGAARRVAAALRHRCEHARVGL